jgi:hypothetical protein
LNWGHGDFEFFVWPFPAFPSKSYKVTKTPDIIGKSSYNPFHDDLKKPSILSKKPFTILSLEMEAPR